MISKKRKSSIKLIEKHAVQTNICSNLKAVFFSKDEASIKRSVQHMLELFKKVYNLLFYFKFKIKIYFLNLMNLG